MYGGGRHEYGDGLMFPESVPDDAPDARHSVLPARRRRGLSSDNQRGWNRTAVTEGRRAGRRRIHPRWPAPPGGSVYGKLTNRSLKSVALAASPRSGVTPKISWSERNAELWV